MVDTLAHAVGAECVRAEIPGRVAGPGRSPVDRCVWTATGLSLWKASRAHRLWHRRSAEPLRSVMTGMPLEFLGRVSRSARRCMPVCSRRSPAGPSCGVSLSSSTPPGSTPAGRRRSRWMTSFRRRAAHTRSASTATTARVRARRTDRDERDLPAGHAAGGDGDDRGGLRCLHRVVDPARVR